MRSLSVKVSTLFQCPRLICCPSGTVISPSVVVPPANNKVGPVDPISCTSKVAPLAAKVLIPTKPAFVTVTLGVA